MMDSRPASDVHFILSVFRAEGLCASAFDYKRIAAQVESQLLTSGLRMLSWEPVEQAGCCAVLVYASASEGRRVDLLELRQRLGQDLASQQMQIRIQREDVFLAMHRL